MVIPSYRSERIFGCLDSFDIAMRVRSFSKLSGLVHLSESTNSVLDIQRVGFRSFLVQNDETHDSSLRLRVSRSSRPDDFVYDTGFVSQPAPGEFSSRQRGRFGLLRTPLVVWVLGLSVGASMLASSNSNFAPSIAWDGTSPSRQEPSRTIGQLHKGHMSPTTSGSAAPAAKTANCIRESIDSLDSIRSWDDSTNRFPKSWIVLNDVALGGVEQIVARPECELATGKVLVINLIKVQSHWKLKSAAPVGPHF